MRGFQKLILIVLLRRVWLDLERFVNWRCRKELELEGMYSFCLVVGYDVLMIGIFRVLLRVLMMDLHRRKTYLK